jgi:hypothetical protein
MVANGVCALDAVAFVDVIGVAGVSAGVAVVVDEEW